MNPIDLRPRIHATMNAIERRLGETKMIHEIPTLKTFLKSWQDGKLKDIYFLSKLNSAYDDMDSELGFETYDNETNKTVIIKFTHK